MISTNKKIPCEVCNFKGNNQREYKHHLEIAHPIVYACSQVRFKSYNYKNYSYITLTVQ